MVSDRMRYSRLLLVNCEIDITFAWLRMYVYYWSFFRSTVTNLFFPCYSRLGAGLWNANTNGIANIQILTMWPNHRIPLVQLRKCYFERTLDRRARVPGNDRVIFVVKDLWGHRELSCHNGFFSSFCLSLYLSSVKIEGNIYACAYTYMVCITTLCLVLLEPQVDRCMWLSIIFKLPMYYLFCLSVISKGVVMWWVYEEEKLTPSGTVLLCCSGFIKNIL